MKRNIIFLFFVLITQVVLGIPARPVPIIVEQSDGTKACLTLVGDERFHYYLTEDGIPVLQMCDEEDVSYRYAMIKNGVMVPSNLLAHSKDHRNTKETDFVNSISFEVSKYINNRQDFINAEKSRVIYSLGDSPFGKKYIGKKKGLVILVNFSDLAMYGDDPHNQIERQFNEVGYNDYGHIGSVHDYFYDQSYGKFDLSFDVVGPITVSNNVSYYGKNDNATGRNDIHVGSMVIEACKLADEFVDFSNYDWDQDGNVDQVFIIYAGYGEASGGAANTIWPHEFSLTGCHYMGDGEGPITLDNVKIDTYACSCELSGYRGHILNGIGTACHEFSHCLGLPDLYDVDYSGAFGMDRWDVMDAGSYSGPSNNGEVPYGYSAFEKAFVGWMELTELEMDDYCELPPLNDSPIAYKVTNQGNQNEFFVLENHQSNRWYSYVQTYPASHGMMVTHIDYNRSFWMNNTVNSYASHMCESIIPADMSYGTYMSDYRRYYLTEEDYAGDLFPGSKNVTRLSGESHKDCGGTLFTLNVDDTYAMSMVVENISEVGDMISFTIGSKLYAPQNISAILSNDNLNVTWEAVNNADEYSVQIIKVLSIIPYKVETFVVDDIIDTSLCIGDMQCKTCNVKVKAKNSFVSSEWSDIIKAQDNTDAITNIEMDTPSRREYYNINGTEAISSRLKGVYIQKEHNHTKKIYIR